MLFRIGKDPDRAQDVAAQFGATDDTIAVAIGVTRDGTGKRPTERALWTAFNLNFGYQLIAPRTRQKYDVRKLEHIGRAGNLDPSLQVVLDIVDPGSAVPNFCTDTGVDLAGHSARVACVGDEYDLVASLNGFPETFYLVIQDALLVEARL